MKRLAMKTGWLVLGFVVCAAVPAVYADTETMTTVNADRVTRKLGRGVINLVTCPAELVRVPALVSRKEGALAGLSVGVAQGAWQMVRRGAWGLYDVVTFPFKTSLGSKSIIQPEFVWAHGNWAE